MSEGTGRTPSRRRETMHDDPVDPSLSQIETRWSLLLQARQEGDDAATEAQRAIERYAARSFVISSG